MTKSSFGSVPSSCDNAPAISDIVLYLTGESPAFANHHARPASGLSLSHCIAKAGVPVNRPLHVWHSEADVKRLSSICGARAVLSPVGMYLRGAS